MCSARIATNEGAPRHKRHRPEKTLLYQIIDEYYPHFLALLEQQGRSIPLYVQGECDDYLQCGRLEYGFFACALRGLSSRAPGGFHLYQE